MDNERQLPLPRIAARVHAALNRCARRVPYADSLDRVAAHLCEVTRLSKRLRICRTRSWTGAEARERTVIARRLPDLEAATRSLTIDLSTNVIEAPSIRVVLEDLGEIETEFGAVRFDRDDGRVAIVTESIVLEGITLGCFELRICLNTLATGDALNALRAVALEPHPCAADDAVTHPHVSAGHVCLGEATATFQSALRAGRLADALQIVRAVLSTYNPNSPFCSLESWYGRACADCGYTANADDVYSCEHCERDYCDECFSGCTACGESSCVGCLCSCPLCDESVCSGCLDSCTRCDQSACTPCLDEGLCPSCLENDDDEENEDDEAIQSTRSYEESSCIANREGTALPTVVAAS